jgi:hypothetical protein
MNPPGYAPNSIGTALLNDQTCYWVIIYNNHETRVYNKGIDFELEDEIEAWMIENCTSRLDDSIAHTCFSCFWCGKFWNFKDALAFFLRWG